MKALPWAGKGARKGFILGKKPAADLAGRRPGAEAGEASSEREAHKHRIGVTQTSAKLAYQSGNIQFAASDSRRSMPSAYWSGT